MERIDAYREFANFSESAPERFKALVSSDPRAARLKSQYSFYAVPGGANGGNDKRIVEVFFGSRPFDEITVPRGQAAGVPRLQPTMLSERGAHLRYERVDDGSVLTVLHPAVTDNRRPSEDFIILRFRRSPTALQSDCAISRDWRALVSYMIETSLDAHPTFVDKARLWWIRLTRKRSVDKKIERPRAVNGLETIISYAFTVGLSGFLLVILVHFFGL